MALDFADFADDEAPSADALARLTKLAARQRDLERRQKEIEADLSQNGKDLRRVSEEELPALFEELGLSEIKLDDGTKVSVRPFIRPPSMGADSAAREPMVDWLEEHDLDDVVKDTLTIQFGKGEGEKATRLAEKLEADGYAHARMRTVHPSTLKATLKEIRERGEPAIPYDELGIQVGKFAKVG